MVSFGREAGDQSYHFLDIAKHTRPNDYVGQLWTPRLVGQLPTIRKEKRRDHGREATSVEITALVLFGIEFNSKGSDQ